MCFLLFLVNSTLVPSLHVYNMTILFELLSIVYVNVKGALIQHGCFARLTVFNVRRPGGRHIEMEGPALRVRKDSRSLTNSKVWG